MMKAMMMMRRFRAMEKRPPLPDDNKDFFFTPREGGKKKRRRRGRRQSAAHFVLLLFSLCAMMIGTGTIPTRHTLLLHLPIPLFFVRSPYVYAIHKDIIQKTLYTNKTLKKREKKKCARHTSFFCVERYFFWSHKSIPLLLCVCVSH